METHECPEAGSILAASCIGIEQPNSGFRYELVANRHFALDPRSNHTSQGHSPGDSSDNTGLGHQQRYIEAKTEEMKCFGVLVLEDRKSTLNVSLVEVDRPLNFHTHREADINRYVCQDKRSDKVSIKIDKEKTRKVKRYRV